MVVVVKECEKCPFCTKCKEKRYCNLSSPCHREVTEEKMPHWCPLNKEQVIVKNF